MSGQMNGEALLSAAAYFRSRPGLNRLLAGLAEKYRSLGRLGGVVRLTDITLEEKNDLEAFFRKPLAGGCLSIPARTFVKALAETKFGQLDPVDVLVAWNSGPLAARQEERAQKEAAKRAVLEQLLAEFPHSSCQVWLKAALNKNSDARSVWQGLSRDPNFVRHFTIALRAIAHLPSEYRRLPVFAREICGDPHGLDFDCEPGKLFLEGLRFIRRKQSLAADNGDACDGKSGDASSSVEKISELLYSFRLLRDDLLNFVTCIGLAAYTRRGEIAYWREAAAAGAPINAPLREIVRAEAFYPAGLTREDRARSADGAEYPVFVVENSGVFSALLDAKSSLGHFWLKTPLICLHGQPKLASWALLDRLTDSGARLSYAGDFDPEGLQIAQKLLRRYPGRVSLWRMAAEDYYQAEPTDCLDQPRLNKLKSITHPELVTIARIIARSRLAAYQEGILAKLASDLG